MECHDEGERDVEAHPSRPSKTSAKAGARDLPAIQQGDHPCDCGEPTTGVLMTDSQPRRVRRRLRHPQQQSVRDQFQPHIPTGFRMNPRVAAVPFPFGTYLMRKAHGHGVFSDYPRRGPRECAVTHHRVLSPRQGRSYGSAMQKRWRIVWVPWLTVAAFGACGSDPMGTHEIHEPQDAASSGPEAGRVDGGADGMLDVAPSQPDLATAVDLGRDTRVGSGEVSSSLEGGHYEGGTVQSGVDGAISAEVARDLAGGVQDVAIGADGNSGASLGHYISTGSMATPRAYHTATLLPNGKVLVAGGIQATFGSPLASAELYNPSTETFSPTGAMTTGRKGHRAALLRNGKVLVVGGAASSSAAMELFDPDTEQFSSAGTCPLSFTEKFAITVLDDGTVLLAGGRPITGGSVAHAPPVCKSKAALYDPAAGSCTCVVAPGTSLDETTAARLADGRVLVLGYSWEAFVAEIYDPATRTFSSAGSTAYLVESAAPTTLANGNVLITGFAWRSEGATHYGARVALLFDPTTLTFAELPVHERRYHHTSTLLKDGRVLIAAGGDENSASYLATTTSVMFDPATQVFTPVGWQEYQPVDGWLQLVFAGSLMQVGRVHHTATLLPNGQVLLVGGESFYPAKMSSLESSAELFAVSGP